MEALGGPVKDLKLFVVLKTTIGGKCSFSTAAFLWHWLTVEEAEAGLVAADVLAVQ